MVHAETGSSSETSRGVRKVWVSVLFDDADTSGLRDHLLCTQVCATFSPIQYSTESPKLPWDVGTTGTRRGWKERRRALGARRPGAAPARVSRPKPSIQG